MVEEEQNAADKTNIQKLPVNEVFQKMGTRISGLTDAEVQKNQQKYGKNVIQEKKGKPVIVVFLSNFISTMAILLWVSGVIAFVAKMPELGIAVWMVNIINGTFSFWQ